MLKSALAPGIAEARLEPRRSEMPLTRAAVATIINPRDTLEVLFIKRASSPRDPWSAHMAFPGGKEEARDAHLLATAQRETLEELGLDLSREAEYLGPLPFQSLSRQGRTLEIHPFVFSLKRLPILTPNHEVAKVLWVELDALANGSRETTFAYEHNGQRLRFPAWEVDGQQVWGLTYRMLQSLLTLLGKTP